MVTEFCGFKHGVIGTDKMPSDTTLNNMKKADLIKLLHTAQHNYESLMWFYNNAVKVNMSQLNNNGWIPVTERLPEVNQNVLVTYEDRYIGGCFGVCAGMYIHSLEEWDIHDYMSADDFKCIAWQPLPAPYQSKGE